MLQFSGNRLIASIWTSSPHNNPPLDLTELESNYLDRKADQQIDTEPSKPQEYMELREKRANEV